MAVASPILPYRYHSVTYSPLTEKDLEETIECLCRVFPRDEPITQRAGITENDFRPFARMFCELAVKENVSLIMRDEQFGNRVTGFSINHDYATPAPEQIEQVTPKFAPVFKVLEELDIIYRDGKSFSFGEVCYLLMAGVDHQFYKQQKEKTVVKGNQLAAKLFQLTLDMVRAEGFHNTIAHATGSFSQKGLHDLGFSEVARIDYNTFEFEGQYPFKRIPWHSCCKIYDLSLREEPIVQAS